MINHITNHLTIFFFCYQLYNHLISPIISSHLISYYLFSSFFLLPVIQDNEQNENAILPILYWMVRDGRWWDGRWWDNWYFHNHHDLPFYHLTIYHLIIHHLPSHISSHFISYLPIYDTNSSTKIKQILKRWKRRWNDDEMVDEMIFYLTSTISSHLPSHHHPSSTISSLLPDWKVDWNEKNKDIKIHKIENNPILECKDVKWDRLWLSYFIWDIYEMVDEIVDEIWSILSSHFISLTLFW